MNKILLQNVIEELIAIGHAPQLRDVNMNVNKRIAEAIGWTLYDSVEQLWKAPNGIIEQPPLYTTSYDRVLELIPGGFDWQVGNVNGHVGGTPFAEVGPIKSYCCNPLISLLVATLRAMLETA